MIKVFKVSHIKALQKHVSLGNFSYSRMVEIMNEMTNRAIEESLNSENGVGVSATSKDESCVSHDVSDRNASRSESTTVLEVDVEGALALRTSDDRFFCYDESPFVRDLERCVNQCIECKRFQKESKAE